MTMPYGADVVTVIHRERVKHGDYVETGRTTYAGCSVQPQGASEREQFGQQTTNRFRVIAPPHFTAEAADVCLIEHRPGRRHHLDGDAIVWRDRTGRHVYTEATLVEQEG